MKKYLAFMILLFVIIPGILFFFSKKEPADNSEESVVEDALIRVETVLSGLTSSDEGATYEGDQEDGLRAWYGPMGLFKKISSELASEKFDEWREIGDLGLYINKYTVDDGQISGRTVIVSGTINDAPFKIRVPTKKGHMLWVEIPKFD